MTCNEYLDCLFPFSSFACDRAFKRCDEEPTMEDCGCFGPRDRPCEDCCLCLSPFGLAVDIVSAVPRCVHLMCLWSGDMYNSCCKKDETTMVVEAAL